VEGDVVGLGLPRAFLGRDYPDQVDAGRGLGAFRWFRRAPHAQKDDVKVTIRAFEEARAAYASLVAKGRLLRRRHGPRASTGLSTALRLGRPDRGPSTAAQDATEAIRPPSPTRARPSYRTTQARPHQSGQAFTPRPASPEPGPRCREESHRPLPSAVRDQLGVPGTVGGGIASTCPFAYADMGREQEAAAVAMESFHRFSRTTGPGKTRRSSSELGRAGTNLGRPPWPPNGEMIVGRRPPRRASVDLLGRLSQTDPGQRSYLADALKQPG